MKKYKVRLFTKKENIEDIDFLSKPKREACVYATDMWAALEEAFRSFRFPPPKFEYPTPRGKLKGMLFTIGEYICHVDYLDTDLINNKQPYILKKKGGEE